MIMQWKTNWTKDNNHARDGAIDLARVLFYYEALKDMLNGDHGFSISFTLPTIDWHRTYPFADLLNFVETTLNALHVWAIPWISKTVTWKAGMIAPTYHDINRWETNGQSIEKAAERVKAAYYYMDELYMGEI